MTKQGFLNKLHKHGALQLVAPSDEIKTAYLRKSESFLASARLLLDNERFEESVSMAYYSMYYSVLALFFATGIKCENHTAAILLLDEVFGVDSSALESAKIERLDKQYYVSSAPVRGEVVSLIRTAESFDDELLDFIDRLTNEKRELFRNRLQTLI